MTKISVIIPSYNHEKYISEAINSVLNQTFQDFEILIGDDGSTDNTVLVAQTFNDTRIKIFPFQKNQGATVMHNFLIKESKGEFISLVNSDDVYYNNKLEKQIEYLYKNPQIHALFSYADAIDEYSELIKPNHPFFEPKICKYDKYKWLNLLFTEGNQFIHPSVLMRRDSVINVGLYDERLAQLPDYQLWVRFILKYELDVLPEKLIKYRFRANNANASNADRPEVFNRLL
ncbi:MAG: glycosyltransferase, partial [Candidatus Roizmanbacteria bacterium]